MVSFANTCWFRGGLLKLSVNSRCNGFLECFVVFVCCFSMFSWVLEVHVKFIAHILLQVLRLHNGESDIEMEKLRMPLLLFL